MTNTPPSVEVIYLSNACGEPTMAHSRTPVANRHWNKVPFESGPGHLLPYLAEVNGRVSLLANLEVPYANEWWGEDASTMPDEATLLPYMSKIERRLTTAVKALKPIRSTLVSRHDDMPARYVIGLAIDLEDIKDRDHALQLLTDASGQHAALSAYPGPHRTDTAVASNYGHWDEHPAHPVADWKHEVAEGDTRLGYWDWVKAAKEHNAETASAEAPKGGPSP